MVCHPAGVALGPHCDLLKREGLHDRAEALMTSPHATPTSPLGLTVPPMGWSWAVSLAQTVLMEIVGAVEVNGAWPFTSDRILVKGGPPPQITMDSPLPHFQYIDDFGIILLSRAGDFISVKALAAAITQALRAAGFQVHK